MKCKTRSLLVVSLCLWCQTSPANVPKTNDVSAPSMPDRTSVSLRDQVIRLTLGEAIYLGMRNNRSIRSAYLQRVAQKYDLRVAEDRFKPMLVLKSSVRDTHSNDDRTRIAELAPTANLLGEYGTRLSLGWARQISSAEQAPGLRRDGVDLAIVQPLLRGAGREVTTAPLRQAQLSEQAQRLNLQASVSRTITEIITAYRDLLRSQAQLEIVEEALKRGQSLLSVNQALIRAGRMAEFDVVQTQADIAAQELGVEEAKNQLQGSQVALLQLLALDLSMPLQATEILEATRLNIDRRDALRLAQTQQPEYLSALLQGRLAELDLLQAKDQARWDLSLVAGASQITDRYDSTVGSGRRWERYTGLQLEIPLGDRSIRQAQVHARVNVERQALELEDTRQALENQVTTVVRELDTLWRQYEIAGRAVELSRRKLDIEREKLAVGRSSNFQVISFEGDLRNAQSSRLDALIAYLNAQTRMELALGMTLESWEIALNDH